MLPDHKTMQAGELRLAFKATDHWNWAPISQARLVSWSRPPLKGLQEGPLPALEQKEKGYL